MKFLGIFKMAVLAIGLATGAAHATTVNFEVGNGTTANTTRTFGLGAPISASASGAIGTSFTLAEGTTSSWFDFITFTVTGFLGGGTYDVAARLAFSAPGGAATFNGDGFYVTFPAPFFGQVREGTLNWSNAVQSVAFGNGGVYIVELEQGLAFGSDRTDARTAITRARVRLQTAPLEAAPIPLPASALLLLAGVGGLAVMRRRRREEVAA